MVLTGKCELTCQLLLHHTRYNNKRSLRRLIKRIECSMLVTLVARLDEPLALKNLQFPLEIHQTGRFELWNVLSSLLLDVGSKRLGVSHAVLGHAREHFLALTSFASDYLGGRRSCRTECLGDSEANGDTLELLASFFLQNDLQ